MFPTLQSSFRHGRRLITTAVLAFALPAVSHAAKKVVITGQTPGVTPFISIVTAQVDDPSQLDAYTFTVQPKSGSQTRPVSARYSAAYLQQRGFLSADSTTVTLPVWGLYAKYGNTVTMTFRFVDGHTESDTVTIQTARYASPVFNHPTVLQARTPDTTLSYDFMLLKDYAYTDAPVILDTDGEVRWVGVAGAGSQSILLYKNGIYTGIGTSLVRMELDGEITLSKDLSDQGVIDFHHNIDFGREGMMLEVDTATRLECTDLEVDAEGNVLHRWDLAQIFTDAMTAGGDDPTQFVLPYPKDWFHNNATTYRPSDNTLLVSSRENFVVALDYDTQAIQWIFGDTTKHWFEFASLSKYALTPAPGTKVPIGQHALSVDRDKLLLFDDGFGSATQMPPGRSRTYSAPRKYRLDTTARTATEVWNFTDGKSVDSNICSSVYVDQPANYLIDYSVADDRTHTRIIGVDATGNKVFSYQYPQPPQNPGLFCGSGWNANIVHLENMVFP